MYSKGTSTVNNLSVHNIGIFRLVHLVGLSVNLQYSKAFTGALTDMRVSTFSHLGEVLCNAL